jgi:hypothetical protein
MMLLYRGRRRRKRRWWRSEPPAIFLSALEGIGRVRNYLISLMFMTTQWPPSVAQGVQGSAESEEAVMYCNGHTAEVN